MLRSRLINPHILVKWELKLFNENDVSSWTFLTPEFRNKMCTARLHNQPENTNIQVRYYQSY